MTGKLIIVMGVSGTGKSTLGKSLADRLGFPFIDGDDYHPKNNIEKMSRGIALNDQNRLPWLAQLREIGTRTSERGNPCKSGRKATTEENPGVVIACSSLKGLYRDILRGKLRVEHVLEAHPGQIMYEVREVAQKDFSSPLPSTYFVWIKGDKERVKDRMDKRQGHFCEVKMLDSQFEALQSPESEPDVVIVPLEPPTEQQVDMALDGLKELTKVGSVLQGKV